LELISARAEGHPHDIGGPRHLDEAPEHLSTSQCVALGNQLTPGALLVDEHPKDFLDQANCRRRENGIQL
jgi:hypothetical protein